MDRMLSSVVLSRKPGAELWIQDLTQDYFDEEHSEEQLPHLESDKNNSLNGNSDSEHKFW